MVYDEQKLILFKPFVDCTIYYRNISTNEFIPHTIVNIYHIPRGAKQGGYRGIDPPLARGKGVIGLLSPLGLDNIQNISM